MSAKININSNMTFESKMNLKNIPVCSKSIKITAILVTFLGWLQYSWILHNYLSFSVRKSSLEHTKAEVSMEITFQTCGFVLFWFFWIHTFICSFGKGQLWLLQINVCYLCFPFIVNQLHIFNCKNYWLMYLFSEYIRVHFHFTSKHQ